MPSYGTYYLYDGNGNVTSNGGKNYRITSNLLNLPDTISTLKVFSNIPNPVSVYYYDANGDKLALAQGTTTFGQSPVYSQYRYYINGIQYDLDNTRDTLDMTFVQTEEGRVFLYSADTTNYYEYFLSDHLGNTTATFNTPTGAAATATHYDDYLPFGMDIPYDLNLDAGVAANLGNEYLYNKKELQENTQSYDYGARFYDPIIARWNVVDPLVEKNRKLSPYNYVQNNPFRLIDPDGMVVDDPNKPILITVDKKALEPFKSTTTTASKEKVMGNGFLVQFNGVDNPTTSVSETNTTVTTGTYKDFKTGKDFMTSSTTSITKIVTLDVTKENPISGVAQTTSITTMTTPIVSEIKLRQH